MWTPERADQERLQAGLGVETDRRTLVPLETWPEGVSMMDLSERCSVQNPYGTENTSCVRGDDGQKSWRREAALCAPPPGPCVTAARSEAAPAETRARAAAIKLRASPGPSSLRPSPVSPSVPTQYSPSTKSSIEAVFTVETPHTCNPDRVLREYCCRETEGTC